MPHATENVTVRMRPEVSQKLEKIAAHLDRSRNWLINQAIEHYLDLHDWQTARIRERLKEAERGGEFIRTTRSCSVSPLQSRRGRNHDGRLGAASRLRLGEYRRVSPGAQSSGGGRCV